MEKEHDLDPRVEGHLEPGEKIQVKARAGDAVLAVTDRRLVVAEDTRLTLAVPFDGVRV